MINLLIDPFHQESQETFKDHVLIAVTLSPGKK